MKQKELRNFSKEIKKKKQDNLELQTLSMLKYLEGVEGAAEDKQSVVSQRRHHPQSGQIADQVHLTDAGVIIDNLPTETGLGRSSLYK